MTDLKRADTAGPFGLEGVLNPVHEWKSGEQGLHDHHDEEGSNDHLASIYETQDDQFKAIVPFLREGLEQGERCLYVADDNTEEEVREALIEGGIDVDAAIDAGALSIHSKADTYLRTGAFDRHEMLEFWEETLAEARDRKGYTGIRAAAEMSWALDEGEDLDRLVQYEAMLNTIYDGEDYVVLCQYNRKRFPDSVLSDVIRNHPLVVYDGTVCQNVHYHLPDEFFDADQPALDIDRTVEGLVRRARTQQALRERDRYQRELYRITSNPTRSFDEKLDALFDLGCEYFDLELGGLARVDPTTDLFQVERTSGDHEHLVPGARLALSETHCRLVASTPDSVVGIADSRGNGLEGTKAHEEFGVDAYLGTRIELDGDYDRTFFFVASEPRDEPFTEAERTFHHLMGQWLEYELRKKQRESRLAALNTLSRKVMHAETQREVGKYVVEAAETTLDLPVMAIALYDESEDALRLTAATDTASEILTVSSILDRGEGIGWTAFDEDETCRTTVPLRGIDASDPSVCEVNVFPLGNHGVLIAGTTGSSFTTGTYDLLKTVAANTESALDRAYREQQLHARENELKELNETLEERVEERTRQVRRLTSRLTMAEQRERRRIANLLHDNLQQRLYGIQLKMSSLQEDGQSGKEKLLRQIKELEVQLDEVIHSARQLSVGMSPPVLETDGLTGTIEWLRSYMKETEGLDVRLSADREFRMEDEDKQVLLFQVTRELLLNVSEHAGVDRAQVDLVDEGDALLLRVIDEGSGFDPRQVGEKSYDEAFGLTAARERIRSFGGNLEIDTAPGEGTRVDVRVPLARLATGDES